VKRLDFLLVVLVQSCFLDNTIKDIAINFSNLSINSVSMAPCSLVPRLSVGRERESLVSTVCACA